MEWHEDLESIAGVPTVALDGAAGACVIIDQTLLPNKVVLEHLDTREQLYRAIDRLEVRGAPAIGVAAAIGMYIDAYHWMQDLESLAIMSGADAEWAFAYEPNVHDLLAHIDETRAYLDSARPTAVNLSWATARMAGLAHRLADEGASARRILAALLEEAKTVVAEDVERCRAIGEHGAPLVAAVAAEKDGPVGVLTHCNAGRLCAVEMGTATAPIYTAFEQGVQLSAFCDETRPLLQGARLTALELSQAGVPTTLLCDNMSNSLMATGAVDLVFVGADRIAANGDTANKIGTSLLALAAQAHGVPFYVCAPTSTVDLTCASGADITIEQRDSSEVTELHYAHRMAPEGIDVYNPAFDVTPAAHIAGIITEKGIAFPPFEDSLRAMAG